MLPSRLRQPGQAVHGADAGCSGRSGFTASGQKKRWIFFLISQLTAHIPLSQTKYLASSARAQHPGRLLVVRHEDLSLHTERSTRQILKFLHLPWTQESNTYIIFLHNSKKNTSIYKQYDIVWSDGEATAAFLQTHTRYRSSRSPRNPYSTKRNSSEVALAWRHKLDFSSVLNIQQKCKEPMNLMGYPIVQTSQQLLDKIPLNQNISL